MDIAHLKTFVEIYHLRHFGKAAEKLYITQSTASVRIKMLEERLGVRLFERNHGKITPTSAGLKFLKFAENIITNWEQARHSVTLPDCYHQTIAIGCQGDIWHFFIRHMLGVFEGSLPNSAFNFSINSSKEIFDKLLAGQLDFGFVFDTATTSVLRSQSLYEFGLALYSTQDKQVAEQCMNEHYLLVDWGDSFLFEHAQVFEGYNTAAIRVSTGLMAMDILRQRLGSAYLPDNTDFIDPSQNILFEVSDAPVFKRELSIVYRSDVNTESMQAIIKHLIDFMGSRA